MHHSVLIIAFICAVLMGCQKGKRITPPEKAPDEITEFQPVEQGADYIFEEVPKSYVPQINDSADEIRKIKDGSYVADVEYFNISTGANVTYTTKVQVEEGYLKVIKWPNGVWLASSYFKPEKIRQDGTCIVKNIEAGYENRVKILNLEFY